MSWLRTSALCALVLLLAGTSLSAQARKTIKVSEIPDGALAQMEGGQPNNSENMKLVAHIHLGDRSTVADVEIEQELSRPYAYVSRRLHEAGVDIVDLRDPAKAKVIYSWRIENAPLHQGA